MKKLFILIIFSFLISSCQKEKHTELSTFFDHPEIFPNGIFSYEENTPRGNYIEVTSSSMKYWLEVRLFQGDKQIPSNTYFDNELGIITFFDNLENGNYQVKFISQFDDELVENISFEKYKRITFPAHLKNYYTEHNFNDFSLKNFKKGDTLQISYWHFGCFSHDRKLIEYSFLENGVTARVKNFEENWKPLGVKAPLDSLNKFIPLGKKYNGSCCCTSNDFYAFKKKGNTNISYFQDGSCKWYGINMLVKNDF